MDRRARVRSFDELTVAVQATTGGGAAVVEVSGEVDMLTAPVLQEALDDVRNARSVLVDLSRVSFLGTSGLAVLGRGMTRAGREHRNFRVVARDADVRRSLRLLQVS